MNDLTDTIPHHEALIYAMVIVAASDQRMTDREMLKIGDIGSTLPVFRGFDGDNLVNVAKACGALLQASDGLDRVLGIIARSLPERLYDTVYALCVEVAAADLHVEQEELRLLQMLRDALELDKLTVAAIERSARARFRTS